MKFNESQMRAILHKDGPMLVLAGPGSGKTKTLVERTKNLIKQGVNPSNILVITFTKAAAMEMKQRFYNQIENKGQGMITFGTFHAVFFMVLKMAYHYDSSNIIKEDVKYQAMTQLVRRYELEYRDENELVNGLLAEISLIKNTRISLEHFYSTQCGEDVFRQIYKDYDAFLRKHRLIDFDDMLTMTYELFKERPDILSAWQKKYQYILVDEFQDINQIQYDIIRMMAEPENNLFMVGDDDQSIYRFRGSKPEIMLHVPKDYPQLEQVELDVNYRCPYEVIEGALKLISHNKERFPKHVKAYKQSQLSNAITYKQFDNQSQEIKFIINKIKSQLEKGYQLSDIAILFRTNTQPRLLMEQLMAYNLDFKMQEQIPNLYEHWIAKDIRAYMDIARGSRKRSDFLVIVNKPNRYIGRNSLCESQVDFVEWEKMYHEQPWIEERIERLHYDIKMLEKMSPYAAINYIRHGIGYEDYINEYATYRNIQKEELYDILDELSASAKGFKTYDAWEFHIQEYACELKNKIKKKNEKSNAITLSTLHGAKGLEFKSVYMIDANEGIMPYKKSILEKDIEEERRLFYVGMTRSIEDLTICSVKNMYGKETIASRFITEAGLILH